jgi:hypothetical protein
MVIIKRSSPLCKQNRPTVQLDDGTLVTSYSWRDAEYASHVEAVRWRLPD